MLGLLANAPASAEEIANTAQDNSQYEVELLVFRNGIAPTGQPDDGSASTPTAVDPQMKAATGPRIAPLKPQDLRLGNVRSKLERLPNHEIILHYGWSQELQSEHAALGVPLPADVAAPGISGVVTAFRGRFLHVALDLQVPAPEETGGYARLRQSRRVKPGVLQYFDNPHFGAIVVLRPAGVSTTTNPN